MTYQALTTNTHRHGGGRVASDAYRASLRQADNFTGLEAGADRYALLLLVKRAGKLAGFTPRMIALLDYYLAFTRDGDWEEGRRPIVYQSLSRTALDLGVSERQVQKLEAALFAAGALSWSDSGNHRRYGQRCAETGQILYAFGVDLTPLAYLREELQAKLHEKKLHDDAWLETKRRISWLRRQVRASLAEWAQLVGTSEEGTLASYWRAYDEIAVQLRTHLDLAAMRSLLARHEALHERILEAMGVGAAELPEASQRASMAEQSPKSSGRGELGFAHYKSTTQPSNRTCSRGDAGFQKSVAAKPERVGEGSSSEGSSSGLEHVTLGMTLGAVSERLRSLLPSDPGWHDLVEAAYQLRGELGVSQQSWAQACRVLGRNGAALCLVITDQAALRPESPVRAPAAYFRGLVAKGEEGTLRLHNSVFGLLERAERRGLV